MKKLLVATVLVGVLTMSLPVMAASPTAGTTLNPSSGSSSSSSAPATTAAPAAATTQPVTVPAITLNATQQATSSALASTLMASGQFTSPAAATAVATSLTAIGDAPELTTESMTATALAVYNGLSAAQKALIQQGTTIRNLSIEEVVGNFVKADPSISDSVAGAWNALLCASAVDGKSGNIAINVSKPSSAVTQSALARAKQISSSAKLLNTIELTPAGVKNFKSLDTALNVQGITAKDSADTIEVLQFYNNQWISVKITAFAKGALGIHLEHPGPIMIVRKK